MINVKLGPGPKKRKKMGKRKEIPFSRLYLKNNIKMLTIYSVSNIHSRLSPLVTEKRGTKKENELKQDNI